MPKRRSLSSAASPAATRVATGSCNAMIIAVEKEQGSDNRMVLVTAEAVRAADNLPELAEAWNVLYECRADRTVHSAEPTVYKELYRYAVILTHASAQLPDGLAVLREALEQEAARDSWTTWTTHPGFRVLEGTHAPVDYTFTIQDWDL